MTVILNHSDARVHIEELDAGKKIIKVEGLRDNLFIPVKTCKTKYPVALIEKILDLKGPAWLCDEILRDESPDYVQKNLKYDLLSYLEEAEFKDKRLLDFGCGSGASTMILARIFPYTKILGIELEEDLLSIARARADYYGYKNVDLKISPNPGKFPTNIGPFDYVVLSAVYEHLLPEERKILLPQIWSSIKTGGILFLNQTPFRYFPIEIHTTGGLPFINYLPDHMAHFYARFFSRRKLKNVSWEELLRKGIRGGGIREIFRILIRCSEKPVLLNPCRFGLKDRIDLWEIKSGRIKFKLFEKIVVYSARVLKAISGVTFLPHLSLAIKKSEIE